MCGIFCIFSSFIDQDALAVKYKICEPYLKRRGPDYYSDVNITLSDYTFIFAGSILWLQGKNLVKQPLESNKSIFVFNGDLFGGNISDEDRKVYGDTILLYNKLEKATSIVRTLSNLQGPYALIYLDKKNLKLYFGRDIFGRRSLLIGKVEEGFIITSTATKSIDCTEVPAIGIFSYDLLSKEFILTPWNFRNKNFSTKLKELEQFLSCNIGINEELQMVSYRKFCEPTEADTRFLNHIKLSFNEVFVELLNNATFLNNVKQLHVLLETAVAKRISTQPKYCKLCIIKKQPCRHALVGVLFSGGLDCTILALLSDKFTDAFRSIDLINVAFQKCGHYNTPDRKTGLESYKELKKLRPNRTWNFVPINVTISELDKERSNYIKHLIHPLNSILDDSLGCALWFASRGITTEYEVLSRVLLVGMGADELFGGYSRHRAALKKNGWLGLYDSLNEDWQNISHRNLARDDRVVADHGRQLRTPYLDENVVDFVRSLNCWEKTCPFGDIPAGVGDKILLRTLAYQMGLREVPLFRKRALQFGSKIANSKENACDVSPRL